MINFKTIPLNIVHNLNQVFVERKAIEYSDLDVLNLLS